MDATPKSHIFISYARADGREYAERLDNDLQAAGYTTWRDTRSIDEYQDFSAEIEMGIKAAKCVVTCITPSIDDNPFSFVRREILYADSIGKPIIPCVFPNAIVSLLVNHLTWLPFFKKGRVQPRCSITRADLARLSGCPMCRKSAPPRRRAIPTASI